jgi:hypothetical protein
MKPRIVKNGDREPMTRRTPPNKIMNDTVSKLSLVADPANSYHKINGSFTNA